MRRARGRFGLALEHLETRCTPALLLQLDGSGNLTGVFGNGTDDVALTFTATDEVNVQEDGNDLGTYSVPGNLTVSLGNTVAATPTLDVDLDGNSMSGSLSLTLGNALNGFTVNVTDGSIDGYLRISSGSGDEVVTLGSGTGTIIGGSLTANLGAGSDRLYLTAGTTVQGHATGNNVNVFQLLDVPAPAVIEGNLILSTREGIPNDYALEGSGGALNSVVNGHVIITTGTTGLGPGDTVTAQGTIGGNLIANLEGGANSLTINSNAAILGSFFYTGRNGDDVVSLNSDITIAGNVSVSAGNGPNQLTIQVDATVLGSFINYIGGNQVDTIFYDGTAPGARLNAYLGAGSDTFLYGTLGGDPTLASLFIDFGAGADSLVQDPSDPFDFPTTFRNL